MISVSTDFGTIRGRISEKATAVRELVTTAINDEEVANLFSGCQDEIRRAVSGRDDGWRTLFPGTRLLEEYARREGVRDIIALQNNLIKEFAAAPERVAPELFRVMERIVAGDPFDGKSLT